MLNISISVSFDAQASTGTRYTRLGVVALKPCTRTALTGGTLLFAAA
uniref:Uncharacterized protein n=1 Tax=Anopheles quadriannulatus TaxID=34691 RepID=A0A182XTG9_ANOQN